MVMLWGAVFARLLVAAVLSLALTASVSAQTKMEWRQKPTGADVLRFYPKAAAAKGVSGRAILDCDVGAAGLLEHCRVADESPVGQGFGDAALRLSTIFRLEPTSVPSEVGRRRLVTPVIFALPGRPLPDGGFRAGEGAWLMKIGVDKGGVGARPCPAQGQPDQLCSDHPVVWVKAPSLMDTLPLLNDVDMEAGASVMLCGVGDDGALKACGVTHEATPTARRAMLSLAPMFVAPPRAADGQVVGDGMIVIRFDWSQITPVVRKLRRP